MNIDSFIEHLKELNIVLNDKQISQLNQYYKILVEWNQKMNLTGITEQNDVYLKHFYDSLTIVKVIDLNKELKLCDIGSGAGFPGIVLKIVYPSLDIVLLDSLGKRITFLNYVIESLKLEKIITECSRAEEYAIKNKAKFDIVTARAVAPLSTLLEYSIPMLKIKGKFIAMKSDVSNELKNISYVNEKLNISLSNRIEFLLPYENSKRTILEFTKNSNTPSIYPRKYSEMKKKPL